MKKLLLLVVLIGKITFPMELCREQLICTIPDNFFFRPQVVVLSVQALAFVKLQKNGCLFGKNVIDPSTPKHRKVMLYALATAGLLMNQSVFEDTPGGLQCCEFNGEANLRRGLILLYSAVHYANLSYDDCLEFLRKSSRKTPLTLIPKTIIYPKILAGVECAICQDTPRNAVNPCNRSDHIYCKECLTTWFSQVRENQGVEAFSCLLCMEKIPLKSKKLEIIIPHSRVTCTSFFKKLCGIPSFMMLLSLFGLYKTLECYY